MQSLKLQGFYMERMMGIEPTTSAWEAKKGWLNSNNYVDSCLIPCLWRFPFA